MSLNSEQLAEKEQKQKTTMPTVSPIGEKGLAGSPEEERRQMNFDKASKILERTGILEEINNFKLQISGRVEIGPNGDGTGAATIIFFDEQKYPIGTSSEVETLSFKMVGIDIKLTPDGDGYFLNIGGQNLNNLDQVSSALEEGAKNSPLYNYKISST